MRKHCRVRCIGGCGYTAHKTLQRLAAGDRGWPSGRPDGDLALPGRFELMPALNRLRT